jgi:hypothetical protein
LTGLFVFGASIAAEVRASDLTVYGSEWIKHTDAFLCMEMYNSSVPGNPATLFLRRSKGATVDTLTAVSDGTLLGKYEMQGYDGSAWTKGALWYAMVDGTPGAGDMPGKLVFATTPDGGYDSIARMTIKSSGRVGINTTAPNYQLEVSGDINAIGYVRSNGTILTSSRGFKRNITPVPAIGTYSFGGSLDVRQRNGAWDLLDGLNVVDFEYKKCEKRWLMPDGRIAKSYDEATSTVTRVVGGRTVQEVLQPDELGGKEYMEWVDEGSGDVHRGFIAEEVPDEFTTDHKSVIISDVVANNTGALKEAKRRILELEKNGGGFDTRLAAVESARANLAAEVQQLATGVIRVEDLKPGAENTAVVMQLTESVLRQLGVVPWVEIALADAIETVPETNPATSVRTVTKYRLNITSRQIEPYTVEESVTEQVPTGKTVERLKAGVRFDEGAGKLYRWVGLASADAAEKLAALRTASQIASLPASGPVNPELAAR